MRQPVLSDTILCRLVGNSSSVCIWLCHPVLNSMVANPTEDVGNYLSRVRLPKQRLEPFCLTVFVQLSSLKELFQALIPYKIKWVGQASVTVAKDDKLLKLAAASGCIDLFIGFESLSPVNLAAVGKKINTVDEYENVNCLISNTSLDCSIRDEWGPPLDR